MPKSRWSSPAPATDSSPIFEPSCHGHLTQQPFAFLGCNDLAQALALRLVDDVRNIKLDLPASRLIAKSLEQPTNAPCEFTLALAELAARPGRKADNGGRCSTGNVGRQGNRARLERGISFQHIGNLGSHAIGHLGMAAAIDLGMGTGHGSHSFYCDPI